MKPKKAPDSLSLSRASRGAMRLLHAHSGLIIACVASYAILFLIAFFANRGGAILSRARDLEVGMVVPEDVIVERDVVYADEPATTLKREARLKLVAPVFQLNSEVAERNVALFEDFREILVNQLVVGADRTALATQLESAGIIGKTTPDELTLLAGQTDIKAILDNTSILLGQFVYDGVFSAQNLENLRSEIVTAGAVELQRDGRAWQEIPVEEIQTAQSLQTVLENRTAALSLSETGKDLVVLLARRFAEENAFYDLTQTEAARQKARQEATPVLRSLVKGQVIARRGDLVSEEILEKVRAHGEDTFAFNVNSTIGTALFLALIYALALYLLQDGVLGQKLRFAETLLLIGLATVYMGVEALLLGFKPQLDWLPFSVVAPTAVFSMVVTILVSRRVGIVFSLLLGMLNLLIVRMEVAAFLFAFLSGVLACAVIEGAERRIDLIRAGLIISLSNALILTVQGFILDFRGTDILQAVTWGVANGFGSGFLTLGLLPILEHLLNTPTRFRLMELSDLNAPIFKKMLNMAPGTYNHSLNLANLAESACIAIGANALLARVGAYYHDIGKIDQAEYFIENQTEGNKHDNLKPSLSASIIKSHVKIGIEKGRELGLPAEVVSFIAQHHGKAVISYFYHRAKNGESGEVKEGISSDDYAYPGERPDTRETAVVMLADAVEATTRTLRKPTMAKLEKAVWEIILDRFHTGELGSSSLTFNDLEAIKQSFVQVLAGHFHSRIEYPKKKVGAR